MLAPSWPNLVSFEHAVQLPFTVLLYSTFPDHYAFLSLLPSQIKNTQSADTVPVHGHSPLLFGSLCEGEPWEGKHKQWDLTSLCSEHLCPKHFGLGLETCIVELCGSGEWEKDLHEEWRQICLNTCGCSDHSVHWIEGRPSHSDTLECVWLLMLSGNDHTRSWSSTGERTSPPSGFLLVKRPWKGAYLFSPQFPRRRHRIMVSLEYLPYY